MHVNWEATLNWPVGERPRGLSSTGRKRGTAVLNIPRGWDEGSTSTASQTFLFVLRNGYKQLGFWTSSKLSLSAIIHSTCIESFQLWHVKQITVTNWVIKESRGRSEKAYGFFSAPSKTPKESLKACFHKFESVLAASPLCLNRSPYIDLKVRLLLI